MDKKRTLIFDFDGTIADTFPITVQLLHRELRHLHAGDITDKEIEELRNKSAEELIKSYKISKIRLFFLSLIIRREMINRLNEAKVFPELISSLKKLQDEGHLLFIVSSNSTKAIKNFLSANDINIFNEVHGNLGLFGKSKTIKRISNRIGMPAFYIGDETRDIEAGNEAGIKTISVTWGVNTSEALKRFNPDFLVNKPEELVAVVNAN